MKVIVHPPDSQKQQDILKQKVAEVYALALKSNIEKLPCSKEQKLRLLREIERLKTDEPS